MADNTVTADSPPLTRDEHLAMAHAHADAAEGHAAEVKSHLDAARAPDTPDADGDTDAVDDLLGGEATDSGGSASRMMPVSAQARGLTAVKSNPTTARVFKAATGRR